jgi:hypothetical protein
MAYYMFKVKEGASKSDDPFIRGLVGKFVHVQPETITHIKKPGFDDITVEFLALDQEETSKPKIIGLKFLKAVSPPAKAFIKRLKEKTKK